MAPCGSTVLERRSVQNEYVANVCVRGGDDIVFFLLTDRCFTLLYPLGHFADHPLSDLVEKIACQFTARHIRGRPKAPYWYPGFPLYVCDSRYHDPRDKGHDKGACHHLSVVDVVPVPPCMPKAVSRNFSDSPDFLLSLALSLSLLSLCFFFSF